MKTVVIAGASGVVGSRALAHLLARADVGSVLAVGRRPLLVQHEKLSSKTADLQSPGAISRELPEDVAIAVCSLGTTMRRAGSRAAFRAIDHDAVVAFAEGARERGASRFVLVSSLGADARSRNFYLKTKGEAEQACARLGYPQLTLVRPSFIDDEGARAEHRCGERIALRLSRALFSVVGKTSRYAPITANTIGRAVVHLAFDDTDQPVRIVESDALHVLGR